MHQRPVITKGELTARHNNRWPVWITICAGSEGWLVNHEYLGDLLFLRGQWRGCPVRWTFAKSALWPHVSQEGYTGRFWEVRQYFVSCTRPGPRDFNAGRCVEISGRWYECVGGRTSLHMGQRQSFIITLAPHALHHRRRDPGSSVGHMD